VAAAREALKPELVANAELETTVLRQGDVFAIATPLLTREIPGPTLRMQPVLGVNHTATEVRLGPDGETYARGFLRHGRRPPEHVTIDLGGTWHRLVKNTVPATRSFDGRVEHVTVRAWSMGGRID
jgi:hypothetical protein